MTLAAASALGDAGAFHAIFFEEADEHLAAMEQVLVGMDLDSPAAEDLNAVFRAAHSIKGTSGMLGFSEIASLTHVLENLLDLLRKGERPLQRRDVDCMLRATDVVKMQVAARRGALPAAPDMSAVEDELRVLAALGATHEAAPRRFSVRLGPLPQAIDASELETMLGGLAEMGAIDKRDVRNVAGGEIGFEVSLAAAEADLKSVLALVVAPELIQIAKVDASQAASQPNDLEPAEGELFVTPAQLKTRKPAADAAVDLFVSPETWRRRRASDASNEGEHRHGRRATDELGALPERDARREADRQNAAAQGDASSIRVSVEKIDRLVNLVGELVITEAMLAQRHDAASQHSGIAGLNDLARHTRNLQEAVMSIRMVPISAVFTRFPRLVRELSQRMGKEVKLEVSGEATELDRGLIEKIVDPLTHLVRNAIDHGLEAPEERLGAGKPRCGTIVLAATQRGGNIVIEVRDDGRGLDRTRILARAVERGIAIAADAPDHEVWQLIFEAGFSTAETVTDISGRGVGMDVVRKNIQLLRGTVDLASSAGTGTTITVSVPLTLAIIEGMTVAVGEQTYVLPLASVVESRRVRREELRPVAGQGHTLRVREDYLPVQRLSGIFASGGDRQHADGEIAVIVESDGARAALMVDALIGQQQVVVKSLEANFRRVPGISSATIMGDGKVALILDIAHIVNDADRRAAVRH